MQPLSTESSNGIFPPRESFPIDSCRIVEGAVGRFRHLFLDRAADIASAAQPGSQAYKVERAHVDMAIAQFIALPLDEQLAALECCLVDGEIRDLREKVPATIVRSTRLPIQTLELSGTEDTCLDEDMGPLA